MFSPFARECKTTAALFSSFLPSFPRTYKFNFLFPQFLSYMFSFHFCFIFGRNNARSRQRFPSFLAYFTIVPPFPPAPPAPPPLAPALTVTSGRPHLFSYMSNAESRFPIVQELAVHRYPSSLIIDDYNHDLFLPSKTGRLSLETDQKQLKRCDTKSLSVFYY